MHQMSQPRFAGTPFDGRHSVGRLEVPDGIGDRDSVLIEASASATDNADPKPARRKPLGPVRLEHA
jgi:hypothetical protein